MPLLVDIKGTTQTNFACPGNIDCQTLHVSGLSGGDADVNTVYLLHLDGSDASTLITDEAGNTWTAATYAQIDTAQSKFGGGSCLFNTTGDKISTPANGDHNFGTGDFTIDFWMRLNSPAGQCTLATTGTAFNNELAMTWVPGYAFIVYIAGTGKTFTTSLNDATWYHIALVRTSGNLMMFVNGTQISTTQASAGSLTGDNPWIVGYTTDFVQFKGWIDEYRVSNIARWTANFTPETSKYTSTYVEGITVVGETATDVLKVGALEGPLKASSGSVGVAALAGPLTFNGTTLTCTAFVNPMTGAGELIYGGASGIATALAAGATTTILVGGGAAAPVWTTATGTGAPVRAASPTLSGKLKLDGSGTNGYNNNQTEYIKNYYESAATGSINILRQFSDISGWGVSGYTVEIFAMGAHDALMGYKKSYFKWGYNNNATSYSLAAAGASFSIIWGSAVSISGDYYYRDVTLATVQYTSYQIKITTPVTITTDYASAQNNVVYLF